MTNILAETLEQFETRLGGLGYEGQWQSEGMLDAAIGGPPSPAVAPYAWTWAQARGLLTDSVETLREAGAGRRHLTFMNPGRKRPGPGTTHTMAAGFQLVRAGEICSAHRHVMSALRFVVEGHPDAYTAVDGERLQMEDNDLLLTPRWSWHDHHNPGDRDIVWLDGLDIPLLLSLGGAYHEPYGEQSQILRADASTSIRTRSHWLRPTWEKTRTGRLPIRYPWAEVRHQLDLYEGHPGNPYDGLSLGYANPVTGGPTLPTIDCWVQRLAPGFSGLPHRRSSSAIGFVVSGSVRVEFDDTVLECGPRDTYVIPNWTKHRLVNTSPTQESVVFSMHDIPVMTALGLYYEDPEDTLHTAPSPPVPSRPLTQIYQPHAFLDRDEL